jgi:polyketide synthase PksN
MINSSKNTPAGSLLDRVTAHLRALLASATNVPVQSIDANAPIEVFGVRAILGMTNELEMCLGWLSKTLYFEYPTLAALAQYFVESYPERLSCLLGGKSAEEMPNVSCRKPRDNDIDAANAKEADYRQHDAGENIAIIGLSCRFPHASNMHEFWDTLRNGRDCIEEIPGNRWNYRSYFDETRNRVGKTYSKWGGFVKGFDQFDPSFFNISPREAEMMDPQERVFLECVYSAVEDAGYTPGSLSRGGAMGRERLVGVYVGTVFEEYQLFRSDIFGSHASIANRISYFCNFCGPSIAVDTMCSSSLTALHLACQSLKREECHSAIAGGVNLTLHPNKYLMLARLRLLSPTGRCKAFGEGGDGYVPAEGVGAVVLKILSNALADGDHIYGVIQATAINQCGKKRSYFAPSPSAQTAVVRQALKMAGISPRIVSYIEAHGTGTSLGDPIEIAGLTKAFRKYTEEKQYCAIGSVKSNIGHCESAAGIAGLSKVLLQMKHRQLVPSLHSERLNPNINFEDTPFVVQQKLEEWKRPQVEVDGNLREYPRIAGLSSFGAGGTNAHVVVEEYIGEEREVGKREGRAGVVLSAKNEERLREQARQLLEAIEQGRLREEDFWDMVYTLQVGREAMEHRLGMTAGTMAEVAEKLKKYGKGVEVDELYRGEVNKNRDTAAAFSGDEDMAMALESWLKKGKWPKLTELWTKGVEIDWSQMYLEGEKPRRVSLPTYPFAGERYWVERMGGEEGAEGREEGEQGRTVLHPLVQRNSSRLGEQRYSSRFSGEEFFLAEHIVKGKRMLPGVAYLEMARAAIDDAWPARPESTVLELHNTVWAQPIVVSESKQVSIALFSNEQDEIDYEIYSQDAEQEIVHCHGRAVWSREPTPAKVDLDQLKREMGEGPEEPNRIYAACARMGLVHGPAFKAITAIHQGSQQVLAHLRLPKTAEEGSGEYVLHPSLMDGALQACVGLMEGSTERSHPTRLPFALESLRIVSPCTPEMAAWVRYAAGSQAGDKVVKLDIDLCDEHGNVCVQMRGFSSRVLSKEISIAAQSQAIGSLLATPVWQASGGEASAAASKAEYTEHEVILCELSEVNAGELGSLLAQSQCLSLQAGGEENLAQRYSEYALACFERMRIILQGKPQGKVLVQIVIADDQEQVLFAGLSGLLKTAALENPQLVGQLILVPADMKTEGLAKQLQEEKSSGLDSLIKYEPGARQVLRWQEVPADPEKPPVAFQEQGVYLITGGLGSLGVLFAKEILEQTREARVVLAGRSALSAEKQALVEGLSGESGRLSYRQVDIGELDQVKRLIRGIEDEHQKLSGIIHSAGMIADNFILKKASGEFSEVLRSKVSGTYNLDQASREVELDFFVMFSSIAGALGNLGQADYATANGFMDQFAAYRNGQVAAKQRHGRTRSINWPLWQAGGMGIDPEIQELLQQTTGMQPMQTVTGMQAFYRSLALPYGQILVVEGDLARIRRALFGGPALPSEPQTEQAVVAGEVDAAGLAEKTQDYLRKQFSSLLKLPSHKIDPQAALEEYGIDSILAMKLTNQLEQTFGSLSKTLFFEYQTIRELTEYFIAHYSTQLSALFTTTATRTMLMDAQVLAPAAQTVSGRHFSRQRSGASSPATESDVIAVIGLSGRYPEAINLNAYWQNLREGKDCIIEVPKERWDWRAYFSDDRSKNGHHYSKWGGFIAGVDEFDPLFFGISPKEAKYIDPQERLFLQHAWMAVEDAGYTRGSLQVPCEEDLAGQVGVYVGLMYSEYQLFGAEASVHGKRLGIVGSAASIANRVSYALNLHGPSMTLDTMCSSSLTAIHVACQDLKQGRTSVAIAGGVNVSIHPNKYLVLSAGQFISSDGHCQSFGEGGDGYIPGEGVGVVVLKRLSEAKRDGDHIYGIIRGSALTHGGKTNGYTVPNPQGQSSAISRALAESHIDARHISYIEAHGTGTKLGDPIEIAALSKAFHHDTQDTEFCRIGSAKSNIGHCESAAGIAGLTKVLLQMQHQQLVPSLHSRQLNPHIDFPKSPFVVNQLLQAWEPPMIDGRRLPRIAGISSFGAGGSNAHMIVEEYVPPVKEAMTLAKVVVLLSARTMEQLRQKAGDLLEFIRQEGTVDLVAMAYTLQVGREAMEERVGFLISSVEELVEKLVAYVAGEQGMEDVYQGQVKRNKEALSLFSGDVDLQHTVDKWIASGKVSKLLELWVKGLELDWSKLYGESKPQRMSLPTYPFAKERYWIDAGAEGEVGGKGGRSAVLHPLLQRNTSDLSEQRYSSTFTGEEFFLADHQVGGDGQGGQKVLPGWRIWKWRGRRSTTHGRRGRNRRCWSCTIRSGHSRSWSARASK